MTRPASRHAIKTRNNTWFWTNLVIRHRQATHEGFRNAMISTRTGFLVGTRARKAEARRQRGLAFGPAGMKRRL